MPPDGTPIQVPERRQSPETVGKTGGGSTGGVCTALLDNRSSIIIGHRFASARTLQVPKFGHCVMNIVLLCRDGTELSISKMTRSLQPTLAR